VKRSLLTVDEAAELVGVSVRTVRRWVAAGALAPSATQGRAALYLDLDVYRAERDSRVYRRQGCVSL
jgi:excisionase family DNA binding protein